MVLVKARGRGGDVQTYEDHKNLGSRSDAADLGSDAADLGYTEYTEGLL